MLLKNTIGIDSAKPALAMFVGTYVGGSVNLVAMAELTDAGLHGEKAAIFAEGSLVQRNHFYAPELMRLLKIHLQEERGRDVSLVIEDGTTLPGAAAAVLMNAG